MNTELRLVSDTEVDAETAAPLYLAQPTQRLRLGTRKFLKLKRRQDTVEAVAWLSGLAILAMFVLDGGLTGIDDIPSALGAISRLTALVATDLLLIHMLLIARVPWIDNLYGHDKATATHKKLGKPILYLVIAHFLASLINFAMLDGKNLWDELIVMISYPPSTFDIPDLLTATISLALMIIVVVTSLNFARKAVSYEVWYIVHLMSYAAVLLAVPHQFSTGSDIAGKPIQTIYWVGLYLFVLFNLVWYRVLAPIVAGLRYKLQVSDVIAESSDTTSVYVSGRNLQKLGGEAGQFYLLRILNAKSWWRPHPFSISAAPNDRFVRFTIGNRGDDTAALQNVKPGTKVMLEGPYGVFTEERRTKEKVTLIAAGIGIPPVRALAESMAARPGDITILYRLRDEEDASLLAEMQEISKRRGHTLHVLAGPRGNANSWLPGNEASIPDHARLSILAPWVSESDVYICGPSAWTKTVVKSLERAGTPASQIHAEEFAW